MNVSHDNPKEASNAHESTRHAASDLGAPGIFSAHGSRT